MFGRIISLIIVLALFIYIVSPIDFVPDFIPIVGWIDDVFAGLMALVFLFKGVLVK